MTDNVQFPKTLAACRKREATLWEIGDALLREVGPPSENGKNDKSYAKLQKVADELEDYGMEVFSVPYLAMIRTTAHEFDGPNRFGAISWTAHHRAGSPDNLKAVMSAAKASGVKKVSLRYVSAVLRGASADAKAAAKIEAAAAVKAVEKAKADRQAADRAVEQAQNAAAKKAAKHTAREARAREKQAKNDAKVQRRSRAGKVKVDPETAALMVVKTDVMALCSEAKGIAKRIDKLVTPHVADLSDVFVNSAVEDLLEISNSYRDVSNKITSARGNVRGHIHVLQGGKTDAA